MFELQFGPIRLNEALILLFFALSAIVQGQWQPTPNDTLVSPRLNQDGKITFQLYAPEAKLVVLTGNDIPGNNMGLAMTQTEDGVWQATTAPLPPGSYRYLFNVDGVSVADPKNTGTSESNMNIWSLVHVPGNALMDEQDVPHGSVAEIYYHSRALDRDRRLHVYTPPGYEANDEDYPVLYLLHGAFDTDDAWTTVGRANFILDNLISAGKVVPMVVVMPAGHTGPFNFGQPLPVDEFVRDFNTDIRPMIENRYRVKNERRFRAIAGLSMGGAQTLEIGIPHLRDFAFIGVFSSGIFGITGDRPAGDANQPSFSEKNKATLENEELKADLELFWFATGKEDFLVETTRATVKMFREKGFDVVYEETDGGHTWDKWRDYLIEFAPKLFN